MLTRLYGRAVPRVASGICLQQHSPAANWHRSSSHQQHLAVLTRARSKRQRDAAPFPSLEPTTELEDFIMDEEGVFDEDAGFDQQLAAAGRQLRLARLRRLQQLYGPQFTDSDVRLYLKKRSLNNGKVRQYRKGGLPLDDALPRPATLAKFPEAVKAIILQERASALAASCRLPLAAATTLYTSLPGLFCYTNLEVAQMLRGLAAVLARTVLSTVQLVLTHKRLMLVHPDALETRVGLLARLLGVGRRAATQALLQEEHLLVVNVGQLAERCEELALLLQVDPSQALQLLGRCPPLGSAPLELISQQLQQLADAVGPGVAAPQLLRLLLWQPLLLVGPAWLQLSQGKVKLPPHLLKRVVSRALKQQQPGQSMSAALMEAVQQQEQAQLQQQQQRQMRVTMFQSSNTSSSTSSSVSGSSSSRSSSSTLGWDELEEEEAEGDIWVVEDDGEALEDVSLGDLSEDAVFQDLLGVFDPLGSDSDTMGDDQGDNLVTGPVDLQEAPWTTQQQQQQQQEEEEEDQQQQRGDRNLASSSDRQAGGSNSPGRHQQTLQQLAQQCAAPVELIVEQVAELAQQLTADLRCSSALAVHMLLACPPVLLLTQQQAVRPAVRQLESSWLFQPQAVQQRQQYLQYLQGLGVVKQHLELTVNQGPQPQRFDSGPPATRHHKKQQQQQQQQSNQDFDRAAAAVQRPGMSDLLQELEEQPALLLLAHQAGGLQQQLAQLQAALVEWLAAGQPAGAVHGSHTATPAAVGVTAPSQAASAQDDVQQLVVRAPWLLLEQPGAVVRRLEVLGGVLNCSSQQLRQGLWQGVVLLPELLRLDLTGSNRVLKTLTSLLGCSVAEVKQRLVEPPSVAPSGLSPLRASPEAAATAGQVASGSSGGGQGGRGDKGQVSALGLLLMDRSRVRAAYHQLQQAASGMGLEGRELQQMVLQHPEWLLQQ